MVAKAVKWAVSPALYQWMGAFNVPRCRYLQGLVLRPPLRIGFASAYLAGAVVRLLET
jgi:hypothetical protein